MPVVDVSRAHVVDLRDAAPRYWEPEAPVELSLLDCAEGGGGWLFVVGVSERPAESCAMCVTGMRCSVHEPGYWERAAREPTVLDYLVLVQDPGGLVVGVAVAGSLPTENQWEAVGLVDEALWPLLDDDADADAARPAWAEARRLHGIIAAMPLVADPSYHQFPHQVDLPLDEARRRITRGSAEH